MPHLSESEAAAWVGLMATHAEIVRALDNGLGVRFGISVSALEVLARLTREPTGRSRMSVLAHAALLSPSRVSRLVDELEGRGLITRSSCPSDSRGVFAEITSQGRQLTQRALEWHSEEIRERFFNALDDRQVDELGAIWRDVGALLAKDRDENDSAVQHK